MAIPEIKRGDPITAKYLQAVAKAASRQILGQGVFSNDDQVLISPVIPGNTVGGGSSTSVSIKIVLIEKDIPGIKEYKPAKELVASDIVLTAPEISAGYTVVLQDPPNDNNFDANHVTKLYLKGYKRTKLRLKVYTTDSPQNSGTAQGGSANTIVLGGTASSVTDFYKGDTIILSNSSSEVVLSYNGSTKTATMEANWATAPVTGVTKYDVITLDDLRLAYVVKDDPGTVSVPGDERKVVQYSFITAYYDDGLAITLGKYDKDDYPDYDENGVWPPPWVSSPDTFFKKPVHGIVINGVLIAILCSSPPPPVLPEAP